MIFWSLAKIFSVAACFCHLLNFKMNFYYYYYYCIIIIIIIIVLLFINVLYLYYYSNAQLFWPFLVESETKFCMVMWNGNLTSQNFLFQKILFLQKKKTFSLAVFLEWSSSVNTMFKKCSKRSAISVTKCMRKWSLGFSNRFYRYFQNIPLSKMLADLISAEIFVCAISL